MTKAMTKTIAMTKAMKMTKTMIKTLSEHPQRATPKTCDLRDIALVQNDEACPDQQIKTK